MRAAARVRGPGWELARSGRPRVPARDTAERACAPRRGREASRPYLLPGQRRQRGAGAREARREKALRMRGQSQRVAPPPPHAADRENTASRRPGPGSTAPPARLEVPSGRARPLAFIPRNYKRSPVLCRRAANSARKSRSATWRTGSTAQHLESCGLESPFRACAVALEKKKHPEATRELLVAYSRDWGSVPKI